MPCQSGVTQRRHARVPQRSCPQRIGDLPNERVRVTARHLRAVVRRGGSQAKESQKGKD